MAQQAISIRTLDPADAGVAYSGNLLVTGPIVEIEPSQTFSNDPTLEPRVTINLNRSDLAAQTDPTSLGLFKLDPSTGTVVPLSDVKYTFLCMDGSAQGGTVTCSSTSAWDVLELDGLTATFSKFAVLPVGTKDSRNWSWSFAPGAASEVQRTIVLSGIGMGELSFFLDDDPVLQDPGDPTPAQPIQPIQGSDGLWRISVPAGTSWVFAVPNDGGLAKSIQVNRIAASLAFQLSNPQRVVIGTVNGSAKIPYLSNHDGRWILAEVGDAGPQGFASDSFHAPGGYLTIPGDILGNRWSDSIPTHLTAIDVFGNTQDLSGPLLVGDAGLPWAQVSPLVQRSGNAWLVTALATGGDAEGPIASLQVSIQTADGRILASSQAAAGSVQTQATVDADSILGGAIRLVVAAYDQGGNHVGTEQDLDLNFIASHAVWWTEAESLVTKNAMVPVCALPSRMAVKTDSVQQLRWTLPDIRGPFFLAGRWRSGDTDSVTVTSGSATIGTFVLPPRRQWGDAEVLGAGAELFLQGAETITLNLPKGMEWDGLALVDSASRLHGWVSPLADTVTKVRVWIRDDGIGDVNMSHPRFYVENLGTLLTGYRARYQVRTEAGTDPVLESYWPTPLTTWWETDRQGLWDMVLDRDSTILKPGEADFQGAGAAFGIHYPNWNPSWNASNDPSWIMGTPGDHFVTTTQVPVFDTTGHLISSWTCRQEPDWSSSVVPLPPNVVLSSSGPVTLNGQVGLFTVPPVGTWSWGSTLIGVTPLDGQPLTGTLSYNGQSWTLSGWWQQIQIPNASHLSVNLRVDLPTTRRIQLQTWEN